MSQHVMLEVFQKNIDAVKHFLDGLHNSFSMLSFTETWLCEYIVSTHIFRAECIEGIKREEESASGKDGEMGVEREEGSRKE